MKKTVQVCRSVVVYEMVENTSPIEMKNQNHTESG